MNAHALPGHTAWLLTGIPGDSEIDRWEETFRERPAAEIARDYAGKDGIPVCVGEHAWDDEDWMRSPEHAEAYARYKGHASPEAYLADRACNDPDWLHDRWQDECRANERDDY